MGSAPFITPAMPALKIPVWLAAAEGDRTIPPERSTSVAQDLAMPAQCASPISGTLPTRKTRRYSMPFSRKW